MQLILADGESIGDEVLKNKHIKGVLFTGSSETANKIQDNLNVRKAYITSGQSFYSILQMGKMDADLTRTAREFVVTENDKYKKLYDDNVLVREGKLEDRREVQKSFEDRFNDIPNSVIPDIQKQKLQVSLKESDVLAEKEIEAMKIILEGFSIKLCNFPCSHTSTSRTHLHFIFA